MDGRQPGPCVSLAAVSCARSSFDLPIFCFAAPLRLRLHNLWSIPATIGSVQSFLLRGDYYVRPGTGFRTAPFTVRRVKELSTMPVRGTAHGRITTNPALRSVLSAFAVAISRHRVSVKITVPGAFSHEDTPRRRRRAAAGFSPHTRRNSSRFVSCTGSRIASPSSRSRRVTSDGCRGATFFTNTTLDPASVALAARDAGFSMTVDAFAGTSGSFFDACHAAVELKIRRPLRPAPRRRVSDLQGPGKLGTPDGRHVGASIGGVRLPFADDTYLHRSSNSGADRWLNTPIATPGPAPTRPCPPARASGASIFIPGFFSGGDRGFRNHAAVSASGLDLLSATAPVLTASGTLHVGRVWQPEYRTVNVTTAIARELMWTKAASEQQQKNCKPRSKHSLSPSCRLSRLPVFSLGLLSPCPPVLAPCPGRHRRLLAPPCRGQPSVTIAARRRPAANRRHVANDAFDAFMRRGGVRPDRPIPPAT